jgi:hypothetical protein
MSTKIENVVYRGILARRNFRGFLASEFFNSHRPFHSNPRLREDERNRDISTVDHNSAILRGFRSLSPSGPKHLQKRKRPALPLANKLLF